MNRRRPTFWIHAALLSVAFVTLAPFYFVLNNSLRTNPEYYRNFFAPPQALRDATLQAIPALRGDEEARFLVEDESGDDRPATAREALARNLDTAGRGYRDAWSQLRIYMINSLVVSLTTVAGVLALASITAYVLARHRFPGSRLIFYMIISTMMFPGVLTLVPSFLLVKELGLLNTYWAMILPYVAGGQVFAIFILRSFFEGLPEDLFEAARMDGAGHLQIYFNIVLPLSKPALAVVAIMNVMGTWNGFLWPYIVNSDGRHHVVASGLYVMATSAFSQNFSAMYAAYIISSIPLLILFIYATRPFIQGVTSGAFKA